MTIPETAQKPLALYLEVFEDDQGKERIAWTLRLANEGMVFDKVVIAKSFRELANMAANIADVIEGKGTADARMALCYISVKGNEVSFD